MESISFQMPVSLSVSDITRYLRELMESDPVLQDVWVQGEVSNLSRPSSGHVYFTLKDQTSALRCVIWKSAAARIRFPMQNGQLLEAHGYVSLYERDGAYQLYVDTLKPVGEGALFQEFLRLKARLETEGLFDVARKRSLPVMPETIGIVTSPTGAALQDMLNTLKKRYRLAEILIAPTSVQGVEAPREIARAIRLLNHVYHPDVLIVARGGGSLEDLWAFNDEEVIRAIADSEAPVITGIGHETDFTLADFAADVRAPTPTGAAVLATPDQNEISMALSALKDRLNQAFLADIDSRRQGLDQVLTHIQLSSPRRRIQNNLQRLDDVSQRMERAFFKNLELEKMRLDGITRRLVGLSPQAVLQRGFSIVRDSDGRIVRSVKQVNGGDLIEVQVSDGLFRAGVK